MSNPLKNVSIDEIQLTISKALSDLLDRDCETHISQIGFQPAFEAHLSSVKTADITMHISIKPPVSDEPPPF
jgi:hypothetical protein